MFLDFRKFNQQRLSRQPEAGQNSLKYKSMRPKASKFLLLFRGPYVKPVRYKMKI
jgi:hypothetical protein